MIFPLFKPEVKLPLIRRQYWRQPMTRLHDLPVHLLARITRNLDYQSVLDLLEAYPLIRPHFIAMYNCVSSGFAGELVPGSPTLPLEAFLKYGAPTIHPNEYIRLLVLGASDNVYDRICSWRFGVVPPEDQLLHALLDKNAFVYLGQGFCSTKQTLVAQQLLSQGVIVSEEPYQRRRHFIAGDPDVKDMMIPYPVEKGSLAWSLMRGFVEEHLDRVKELVLETHFLETEGPFLIAHLRLPSLQKFTVIYKEHFPHFLPGNIIGSPIKPMSNGKSCTELSFIHLGCDDPGQTTLTGACHTSDECLRLSDWSFTSNFEHLRVLGGPNSLINHIDLSNTFSLRLKRASRQLVEDLDAFPKELIAPNLHLFFLETLIANTVIPKIKYDQDASWLIGLTVITHRHGLKWNGILRDHNLLSSVILVNKITRLPRKTKKFITTGQRTSRKRGRSEVPGGSVIQDLNLTDLADKYPYMSMFELFGPFRMDSDMSDFRRTLSDDAVVYFNETEDSYHRGLKRMKLLEGPGSGD